MILTNVDVLRIGFMPAKINMASARDVKTFAKALGSRQWPLQSTPTSARRFNATIAEEPSSQTKKPRTRAIFADLEQDSSFKAPLPTKQMAEEFSEGQKVRGWSDRLPSNRYQYHPPKYYRGPLHPVQMPRPSDPVSREFVPGPFNVPRMKHTYDSTIAPDILTMTYQHRVPGETIPETTRGQLRAWDGSSPYHKNRPRRGPRGPRDSTPLEQDVRFNSIPELLAVSVDCYNPENSNKEVIHTTRAVLQAITGAFPETTKVKRAVVQWRIRQGDPGGAKATLRGNAAYEFLDKLIHLVLPRIKDWPGIKASTGDHAGNLAMGLRPEWMTFFPEIEQNYSMYPTRQIPGCNIYIQTTATSDRQARLLLEALGMPFYGKVTHS